METVQMPLSSPSTLLWTFVDSLVEGAQARLGTAGTHRGTEAPSVWWRRAGECIALRPEQVHLSAPMRAVLEQQLGEHGRLCFVAKSPTDRSASAYEAKLSALRRQGVKLNRHELLFLEVGMETADPSTPTSAVVETEHGFQVLRVHGHAVPNAIAALLLAVAADLGVRPEIYLEWRERNPLRSALDYVAAGHGDVGPVLREVLRRAEPDRSSRPQVHLA